MHTTVLRKDNSLEGKKKKKTYLLYDYNDSAFWKRQSYGDS
jgi:hypothetical protein